MITAEGYSKDPSIMPEGIAVTFGKDMIEEKGGLWKFLHWFESAMESDDDYWMHKCKNCPQHDIIYVYVIIHNRVKYRCSYGGHRLSARGHLQPDGPEVDVPWSHVILAGPVVHAPHKIIRSGFRGFRYTTKLF